MFALAHNVKRLVIVIRVKIVEMVSVSEVHLRCIAVVKRHAAQDKLVSTQTEPPAPALYNAKWIVIAHKEIAVQQVPATQLRQRTVVVKQDVRQAELVRQLQDNVVSVVEAPDKAVRSVVIVTKVKSV